MTTGRPNSSGAGNVCESGGLKAPAFERRTVFPRAGGGEPGPNRIGHPPWQARKWRGGLLRQPTGRNPAPLLTQPWPGVFVGLAASSSDMGCDSSSDSRRNQKVPPALRRSVGQWSAKGMNRGRWSRPKGPSSGGTIRLTRGSWEMASSRSRRPSLRRQTRRIRQTRPCRLCRSPDSGRARLRILRSRA